MLRVIAAGLCVLFAVGCGEGDPDRPGYLELATGTDGGADAGPEPACNWFVYWLTMVDREAQCNWGMFSNDPTVALFRSNGGECLTPATICGLPACSDITFVREKQVIEVWGPAGLDAGDVWRVTESFDCVEN